MTTSAVSSTDRHESVAGNPGRGVVVVAVLMALWCLGFAVTNIVLELTDRLADGPYAEYASAFTVMNWLVVGLKVLGAGVALLSVADRPRLLSPTVLSVLLWGVFATLGVYALGSLVQALGMVSGLMGSADQVDPAGIGYVLFFLSAATGYGVLAISYARRHGTGRGLPVIGALGAPAMLILLLVAVPALLAALGFMPAS